MRVKVAALRKKDNPNVALRSGSLQDIYEMSTVSERTHWVNILDVPLGDTSVPVPPQYRYVGRILMNIGLSFNCGGRHLTTLERAMQETRGMAGFPSLDPRNEDTSWATVALKHCVTWPHMDDEGFGTVVTNRVGSKYWVVARQRRDAPSGSLHGDMGTMKAIGDSVMPTSAQQDIYEHEAVLLLPGTVL